MYNAYITKIKSVQKHPNADRLNVGDCFGSEVIVSLETKEGDIGVYFPSDGELSMEYCEANNLLIKKDENGNNIGGYLDPNKRHVRPLKLRGVRSDGLFMPLKSLSPFCDVESLKVGDEISVLNGVEICRKYVPKSVNRVRNHENSGKKGGKITVSKNRVEFPFFKEHIDTSHLPQNLHRFKEGDLCYITLKVHGTSSRHGNVVKNVITEKSGISKAISKLLKKPTFNSKKEYDLVTGTRRVVLKNFEGGYYGNDGFRQKWHEFISPNLKKGESLYGEIVGFVSSGKPIMPSANIEKLKDKELTKKYGKTMIYSYGCEDGENDFFVYRMTMTNEDGFVVEYPWELVKIRAEQMGLKTVMELEKFVYTTQEDLMERVNKHLEGADPIGLTHEREGVVVRIDGRETFTAFKHKGFTFRLCEGMIKDSGVVDMEEAESVEEDVLEEDRD